MKPAAGGIEQSAKRVVTLCGLNIPPAAVKSIEHSRVYDNYLDRHSAIGLKYEVVAYVALDMKSILSTLVVIGYTLTASGIEAYLTMENDTFSTRHDDDYTHGTKLEVVDGHRHYMLQQTMYAPSDLDRKDHIVGDRPYCGMLIVGIGYEFLNDPDTPWTHYGEFDFGMIGPAAGCKETQTLIHKWLGCREPKGWDNQLHNEFVVNGQWWTKYNWHIADWIAVVPRAGVAAGTIQDFAEVGCDLKIGWNIRPTPANDLILSSARDGEGWAKKVTAYVYVGVDERYYLYNHVLEGSMFGHRDDGLDVKKEPFVGEFRFGAVVKVDRFFATYYSVIRQDEFKHQKNSPNYGGIGIGWGW